MNLRFAPHLHVIAQRITGEQCEDACAVPICVATDLCTLLWLVQWIVTHADDILRQSGSHIFNGMHLRVESDAAE
jgi:hypothetical protein